MKIIKTLEHKEYQLNKKHHRRDGPSVEYANGDKEWWANDSLHRKDGPAIEYDNGNNFNEWWVNGKFIKCG